MSSMIKGIILGAGGALGVASQSDSMSDVPKYVFKSMFDVFRRASEKGDANMNSSNSNANAKSEDLANLSNEIRELRLSAAATAAKGSEKQIIVYNGESSGLVYKLIIVTTAGVVVAYYFGYGFNDIMYVTKTTLNSAVKKLEEKVGYIGVKLEKTKEELLAMIAGVEETIFATSKGLETKIDSETERIRAQIMELDGKFARIELTQEDIKKSASSLDGKIMLLQEKFDINGFELERANSGIRLLVNSVVDLPHLRDNKSLMSELRDYLKSVGTLGSWFGNNNYPKSSAQTKSEDKDNSKKLIGLAGLI